MTPLIDNESPNGAWKDAIEREEKRNAANRGIIERNDRIKAAWRLGEDPHAIAGREGVGVDYVRQVGRRWER